MSLLLPLSKSSLQSSESSRKNSVSQKKPGKGSRIARSLLHLNETSSQPKQIVTSSATTIISPRGITHETQTDKIRQVTAQLMGTLPNSSPRKSASRDRFHQADSSSSSGSSQSSSPTEVPKLYLKNLDSTSDSSQSSSPIKVPPLILKQSNSAPTTSRPETASSTRPRSLSSTPITNRRLSFTPRGAELVFERNHLIAPDTQEAALLNNIYKTLYRHLQREKKGKKKLRVTLKVNGEKKKFNSKQATNEILKTLGSLAAKGLFFWNPAEDTQLSLVDILDRLCATRRFARLFSEHTKKTIRIITLKCLFGKTADEARRVSYLLELWDEQPDQTSGSWPPLKSWIEPLFKERDHEALPIETHASSDTTYTYAEFETLFYKKLSELSSFMQKFQEAGDYRSFSLDTSKKSIFEFTFQEHLSNAVWLKDYERKRIKELYSQQKYRDAFFEIYRQKAFIEFTNTFINFNSAFTAVVKLAKEKYSKHEFILEKADAIIAELNPEQAARSSSDTSEAEPTNWINLRLLLGQFSFLIEEFEKEKEKPLAASKSDLSFSDSFNSIDLSSEEPGEDSSE